MLVSPPRRDSRVDLGLQGRMGVEGAGDQGRIALVEPALSR
ncbi:hypothetical protein PSC71_18575 [Devosia sp. J2-20]|nr:hypothetical protein [Devosia sp. J2-20]WDQ99153.1 hypothetical protein PSC71_18575 [Devosia sp. J2-20]